MAVIETWFHQDLQEPVKVNYLNGNLFSNNGNGNRIGIVLTNNGENLSSISGTVSGYVVTADGSTVPCTGSKSGNRASILIPAAAYQPGSIFITVFVTDGTTVTTIGAVCTTVMRSRTNAQVDPGSAVTDWTQTINAAMQSVETAAANLGGIVAVPYASITFPVPLGKYTYYNNNLYRCISPIASSESFTAAHWTQVRLGDDVSDLKSAIKLNTEAIDGTVQEGIGLYTASNSFYSTSSGSVIRFPIKIGVKYCLTSDWETPLNYYLSNEPAFSGTKEYKSNTPEFLNESYSYLFANKKINGTDYKTSLSCSDRTKVYVNNEKVDKVEFDSDPQEQIDHINTSVNLLFDDVEKTEITPIEIPYFWYNGALTVLSGYNSYAIPLKPHGLYKVKLNPSGSSVFSNAITNGASVYNGVTINSDYSIVSNTNDYKYLIVARTTPSGNKTVNAQCLQIDFAGQLSDSEFIESSVELETKLGAFDDGKFVNLGGDYSVYYFQTRFGKTYKLTSGSNGSYAFSNSIDWNANIYGKTDFYAGETYIKNDGEYRYLIITKKINAVETSSTVKEYSFIEQSVKKDLSGLVKFISSSCVVSDRTDPDYGKIYSGSTFSGYSATEFIDVSNFEEIEIGIVGATTNSLIFGLVFYDEEKQPVSSYLLKNQAEKKNYTANCRVPTGARYAKSTVWSDFETYGTPTFKAVYYPSNIDKTTYSLKNEKNTGNIIRVAAYNASLYEKINADVICDGENDEVEIQNALDNLILNENGSIMLSSGNFNIDSFQNEKDDVFVALAIGKKDSDTKFTRVTISGAGKTGDNATIINVTNTALTELGENTGILFGTLDFLYLRMANYSDFNVILDDNQHNVTVIDNTGITAGICNDLYLFAVPRPIVNTVDTPMPATGCAGITGYCGDDNGTHNEMNRIFASGFYEGFRLGGEHLVCKNLVGRFNYYTYTFGNYDWKTGTQSHPITLINCADERSACFPKFVRCGQYDEQNQKAMQQVDLIGYNMEISRIENFGGGLVEPAVEVTPGSFCGRVEFTGYGAANVEGKSSTGVINNPNIQFWATGSGECFETKNMVHKKKGTTTERNAFTPQYMQQYFDTTLDKMLIYTGSEWVDMNGNVAN